MKPENYPTRQGVALLLSGPSGAGKTTVYRQLLASHPEIHFSVSCTTRSARQGEVDGEDYHFLTRDDFRKQIDANDFLEWAEVHGNYYGTLRSEVAEKLDAGTDVLLDIDVQGARQIRKVIANTELEKNILFIFIAPPSFAELEKRLRGRGTEKEETIAKRLGNAKTELTAWREYDFLIVNDDLDEAIHKLKSLLVTARCFIPRLNQDTFHV